MRTKSGQISIMAVCLVLGIMLSIQFKTSQNYGSSSRGDRTDQLIVQLNDMTTERDSLAQEVISLRQKLANVKNNNEAATNLQEELRKSNMVAGLLPVEGPGIIVTVNDSPRNAEPGENPNDLLVHDEDLLKGVNELRASGAEAISINDQRITALSEIRCAGTTILVNTNKIAPPFVIRAVGDAQMMESGLMIRFGWVERLKGFGIQVQIEKSQKVSIPAYNGAFKFKYSQPAQK